MAIGYDTQYVATFTIKYAPGKLTASCVPSSKHASFPSFPSSPPSTPPGTAAYSLFSWALACGTPITTIAECAQAARALGLSDTTPSNDGQGAWDPRRGHDPPYCYFERVGASWLLKFNAGTNTGRCTPTDICVCAGAGPRPLVCGCGGDSCRTAKHAPR